MIFQFTAYLCSPKPLPDPGYMELTAMGRQKTAYSVILGKLGILQLIKYDVVDLVNVFANVRDAGCAENSYMIPAKPAEIKFNKVKVS